MTLCVWKRESKGETTTWDYCKSSPRGVGGREHYKVSFPFFLSRWNWCSCIQTQWKCQSMHSITVVTSSAERVVKFTDVVIQGVTSLRGWKEQLDRSDWVNGASTGRAGPKGSLIPSVITETKPNKHSPPGKPHDLMWTMLSWYYTIISCFLPLSCLAFVPWIFSAKRVCCHCRCCCCCWTWTVWNWDSPMQSWRDICMHVCKHRRVQSV